MPQAEKGHTTGRRGALAGALGCIMLPAVAAAAPVHQDAGVLAMAREFMALDDKIDALDRGLTREQERLIEPQRDALHERQSTIAEQMAGTRVSTLEGLRAKAVVANVYRPVDEDWREEYLSERCRSSLVADLLAWPA